MAFGLFDLDGDLLGDFDALVVAVAGLALRLVLGGALHGPVVTTRAVTVRAPALDQLIWKYECKNVNFLENLH